VTVLCLVELDEGRVADASLRALRLARDLAGPAASLAVAIAPPADPAALGTEGPVLAELGDQGVATVLLLETDGLAPGAYAPAALARGLASATAELGAVLVLAPANTHGQEILGHLAAIADLPFVANCTTATWEEPGVLTLTRQRWGGSLLEDARLAAPAALLSVATDAVTPAPAVTPTTPTVLVHRYRVEAGELDVVATTEPGESGGVALSNARVVVSGGRGVGGPEGFGELEELARLLGGAVGVSRVVTSLGWRPHREQVGQTGTKVTPELYLACGISGAVQHLAGCQGARHMVAINTDADAPIMARADYAVIGDVSEVLPVLVREVRARKERAGR
jgi:electron transfer flavoprotein alpha subunit